MQASLAVRALENAVTQRGNPTNVAVRSDRGSQFRSRQFVLALGRNDMAGSMGRVGAAGDNAAMESFFALLQKNVLDRQRWDTREQLRIAIVTWIEHTYNHRRRQRLVHPQRRPAARPPACRRPRWTSTGRSRNWAWIR